MFGMVQRTTPVALLAVATCLSFAPRPVAADAEWHLQWSRSLVPRKPAWEFTQRMPRDVGHRPVVAGDLVLVGQANEGSLLALNARTGWVRWEFLAEGPIRVAPVAADGRIFVGSDDGTLYCLDREGGLLWKRRGGPSARKVIGHGQDSASGDTL